VLLVRHTYGPQDWELPGGSLKRGEAPEAGAAREVREELGLRLSQLKPLGQVAGRVDFRRDVLYCFAAEVGTPALTLDQGEIAAARWFAWNQLPPDLGRYSRAILDQAARSS
jgi:8-oxo-dGTP pyrophosphatase MutT (NUDIX family)